MAMKIVRLSVDAKLLERARQLKLDPAIVFDAALANAIRKRTDAAWLHRNGTALQAYNEHAEKHGVFSESLRSSF